MSLDPTAFGTKCDRYDNALQMQCYSGIAKRFRPRDVQFLSKLSRNVSGGHMSLKRSRNVRGAH